MKRQVAHNKKSVEEHVVDGTYRRSRHGELPGYQHKPKPPAKVKGGMRASRKWCRNAADERALKEGCRFNEALAEHVCSFFADHLCFSKGEWYGKPFIPNQWQRESILFPIFGWVRPDGTRRIRRTYIEGPKKLTYKSTTAAGIGLYGLFADEENGAEIYSLGADGDQAGIVHREAISMIEASPSLNDSVNINRTTGVIVLDRTRSYYKKLSGSPRGKHGINAHFGICDELHEWYGREMWDTLRYAYRARRQPLEFVITNAGDDKTSVCFKQREKAIAIRDGQYYDDSFYPLVLAVPEEDAKAEIQKIKNGGKRLPVAKSINPGLGHLISESDLLRDIKDAINQPSDIPNLLRLTYGVWEVSEHAWIEPHHWEQCHEAFTIDDLRGKHCAVGLDLAKTRDTTAAVFVFAIEDKFYLLPYFWLPEAAAQKHKHIVDYMLWADQGYITLTAGEVCDYSRVKADLVELFGQFKVDGLLFDPYNAEQLTQELSEECRVEREDFKQNIVNYTSPTKDFERLLISRRIVHNSHPVLSWQFGHVQVYSDNNGNIRPIKPNDKDDSYKKIDGVVASIMGLSKAMETKQTGKARVFFV